MGNGPPNDFAPLSHGRDLGGAILAVDWAVFGPSSVMVCLRMINQLFITRNFGWDDGFIAIAQVSLLKLGILSSSSMLLTKSSLS